MGDVRLGDKIRDIRIKNGMSQEALAEILDVTKQSVFMWESGATMPGSDKIIAICRYFSISADDLLLNDYVQDDIANKSARQVKSRDAGEAVFESNSKDKNKSTNKKGAIVLITLLVIFALFSIATLCIIFAPSPKFEGDFDVVTSVYWALPTQSILVALFAITWLMFAIVGITWIAIKNFKKRSKDQ